MGRTSGRRSRGKKPQGATRDIPYRQLVNPLAYQRAFSDDQIESIHNTALRVLEELGVRVLNDAARHRFAQAGAELGDDKMVRLDRGLVESCLESAPSEFTFRSPVTAHDVTMGGRHINFASVGGPPSVSDIDRGKRNGTLEDTRNIIKLCEHFDVIHMQSTNVESQDVPLHLRHLHTTESQLTLSTKPFFIVSSIGK